MSEWWEVSEGECYRHKFTHALVRVTRVRPREGFTGLVRWEALNGATIDADSSEVQEAQHFLEEFGLVHVASPAAAYSGKTASDLKPWDASQSNGHSSEPSIQLSSLPV